MKHNLNYSKEDPNYTCWRKYLKLSILGNEECSGAVQVS